MTPATRKTVDIIGIPSDLGANVRGANIGPSTIRIAGLKERIEGLGYQVVDTGDVSVPVRETVVSPGTGIKFLPEVVAICESVCAKVQTSLENNHLPVMIGGDHSLAIGSMAGVQRYFSKQRSQFGCVWIDAHADLNTSETSPSGNAHGMPLSALLGLGDKSLTGLGTAGAKLLPENVALVGIRIIDAKEKEVLRNCGIRYFTMREIDERGMFAVMKDAIAIVSRGTEGIHLSFDLDAVDPVYAPGVSWPYPGGLNYREAHLALEMIADTNRLCSMDMVELNPVLDEKHVTANLAIELIQSALGKSIV